MMVRIFLKGIHLFLAPGIERLDPLDHFPHGFLFAWDCALIVFSGERLCAVTLCAAHWCVLQADVEVVVVVVVEKGRALLRDGAS